MEQPQRVTSDTIPQQRADRRQLQQIIAGLTEGVILIDPDQSISWANEAALAMHGVEELKELGATVSDYRKRFELRYRNNHRLSKGAYPMDRVLAGEAFSDVIVAVARVGADEPQRVHRIRSLVLTDSAGNPDCLVLVLHDATERFSAEERFERTFGANPAPAIICRLSDLRYVKVNQGFQEMTGYSKEDLIGRSVYEIDVLENAENKELAIERLNEGGTVPQMEALLKLPSEGTKFVIVAGQPIEIGEEPCMLFTFIDLEPRKKAEDALRQSEERFSKAFRLAPVAATVSTLDGFRILEVNDAFIATTGYATEEVVGRNAAEIQLWESPAARKRLEQELVKTGGMRNLEIRLRTKQGDLVDCLVSAETVAIQDQPCVLSVLQDITERKRSEVELVAAIEAVMQDTSWFSRTVIEKLANLRQPHGSNRAKGELSQLTARERGVLGLICQGLADKQIAQQLEISLNTVRNHVATIYRKIDVHRRSAAIVWARERGFTGGGSLPSENRKGGKRPHNVGARESAKGS
jgi:PAS domain S-box-containing protein